MKGKKEQDGPVAFIKSDKSRIIEVSEGKEGKFEVVGVYHRIDVANISLGSFHPKKQYGGGGEEYQRRKRGGEYRTTDKGVQHPTRKDRGDSTTHRRKGNKTSRHLHTNGGKHADVHAGVLSFEGTRKNRRGTETETSRKTSRR